MEYTRIIKVPKTVSPELFSLDCVHNVCKCLPEGISYTVDAVSPLGNVALKAYPGDFLCELRDGSWMRISSWDIVSIGKMKDEMSGNKSTVHQGSHHYVQ